MLENVKTLCKYLLRRKRYFIEVTEGDTRTKLWIDGFRRPEYVVPRKLCYYKMFDCSNVKREFRDNALNLQIRKWSPIQDYVE